MAMDDRYRPAARVCVASCAVVRAARCCHHPQEGVVGVVNRSCSRRTLRSDRRPIDVPLEVRGLLQKDAAKDDLRESVLVV